MIALWLNMLAVVVVIVFALYASFSIIIHKNEPVLLKVISFVTFALGLYMLFRRDTYLPFLGVSAVPAAVVKDTVYPSDSNAEVTILFPNIPDGTKVVYWGAKPASNVISNPWTAYDDFSNSGVAIVVSGKAVMRFNCPAKYQVGAFRRTLNRHIHYRVCDEYGMMGPVQTKFVNC